MTDEITTDDLRKFLESSTGFSLDQAQADAIMVLVEAIAVSRANSFGGTPLALVQGHVDTLIALGRQLLDTGGRMRLHPEGQLDDPGSPLATRSDLKSLADGISILAKRQDDIDVAIAARTRDAGPELDIHLKKIEHVMTGVELAASAREQDLSAALKAQLEALTATVIASRPDERGNERVALQLESLAAALNELRTDVAGLKAASAPAAYVPVWDKPAEMTIPSGGASFTEAELDVSGIPDWEMEFLEAQAGNSVLSPPGDALADSLRIIGELREEKAAGDAAAKHVAKDRAGCYFNDDGTITCRMCGIAKVPDGFSKDRRAWTGRKSSCKDCQTALRH